MAKSLESILSSDPSGIRSEELPDTAESESPSATEAPTVETKAEPTKGEMPAAKASGKPAAKPGDKPGDDDGEDALPEIPKDFAKLEKLVTEFHGDRRKARGKVQELKTELAKAAERESLLRQQLQQLQQPQATPQKREPTPEEFEVAVYKDLPGTLKRFKEEAVQAAQQAAMQTKLVMSEAYARRAHSDFEEKMAAFKEAAQTNPAAVHFAMQQADPFEYAYQTGAKLLLDKEIGSDPTAYRQRIEAEVRAQLEAERSGDPAAVPAQRPPIPKPSLATARGTGAGAAPAFSGPTSLKAVLG